MSGLALSSRRGLLLAPAAILTLAIFGAPTRAAAQTGVIHACYVPASGTVYRIREPALKDTCNSPQHIAFSRFHSGASTRLTPGMDSSTERGSS